MFLVVCIVLTLLLVLIALAIAFWLGRFTAGLAILKNLPKNLPREGFTLFDKPVLTWKWRGEIHIWPEPFTYTPPAWAEGNTPRIVEVLGGKMERGRPTDSIWPSGAAKYFKDADEFFVWIREARVAKKERGGLARLCKYHIFKGKRTEIPPSTADGWLKKEWTEATE